MKRSKIFLLAGLVFTMSTAVQAQQDNDPKAKAILDELSAKTKSYTTIKSDFTITLTNKQGKVTETQNGTVHLKGEKYKLLLPGQDVLSDGKYTWTYVKEAKETQKNYADKNSEGMTPTNIFTMYEKGFKCNFEKEEKGIQIINLHPLKPDGKKYHTIKLMIDKAKKQISSVKVLNKDGTTQTITIKNFTPNSEMKDTMFQWNNKDYPGELIELTDEPN